MIRDGTNAKLLLLGLSLSAAAACLGPGDTTGVDEDAEPTGTIIVATITTGPGSDPTGYLAVLNEGLSQPIEANGSVTFGDVRIGTHNVWLDGVDSPCVLTTTSPVAVLLLPDSTVTAQFDVNCPP